MIGPLVVATPCPGDDTIVAPVGANPLIRQVATFSVPGVLTGTDNAQGAGVGTVTVKGTTRLPVLNTLVADKVAENKPGMVGVPLITPLVVLMVRPGGKLVAA